MPKHTNHEVIVKASSINNTRAHNESESEARTGHQIDLQRIQNTSTEAAAWSNETYMKHINTKGLALQQEKIGNAGFREMLEENKKK